MVMITLIHDAPAHAWYPDRPFDDEPCETLLAGSVVEYRGTLIWGMLHIRLPDGRERVIHPATTKECGT